MCRNGSARPPLLAAARCSRAPGNERSSTQVSNLWLQREERRRGGVTLSVFQGTTDCRERSSLTGLQTTELCALKEQFTQKVWWRFFVIHGSFCILF